MSTNQNAPEGEKLLLYPLATSALEKLQERLRAFGYKFFYVKSAVEIAKIDTNDLPRLALIELDSEKENSDIGSIITSVRKLSSVMKIVGVFKGKLNYNPEGLIKKGIDFVHQIPFEEEVLINCIFEFAPIELQNDHLTVDGLSRVNVIEIEWANALPFDIFVCLPSNKKIIHYRQKGQSLDNKSVEKFRHHKEYALYIKKSDLSAYYTYSAQVLSRLQKDGNLSKLEKERKLAGEVKKIMSSLFSHPSVDEREGSEMLENVRKVLGRLEDSSGSKKQFANTLLELAAQNMTNYTHCRNVATYCALFGLALGIHEPETLQMGGFLHDIGMSDLPPEFLTKEWSQLTDSEKEQYKLHPGNGAMTVKFKKMKLPPGVMNMITQHHERPDGSGFPYGLAGDKIDLLAKVCAFADEFDELTSLRFGHKTCSPAEAVKRIAGLDGNPPSKVYEHDIFKPLVASLLEEMGETVPEEFKTAEVSVTVEATPLPAPEPESEKPSVTVIETEVKAGKIKVVEETKPVIASGKPTALFATDNKPVIDAISQSDLEALQRAIKSGVDINLRDENGLTPLLYALKSGKRDIAKAVLRAKADMNVIDNNGNTPLMHAIELNNFEMFNLLLVHAFESSFVPGVTATSQAKGGKTWASNVLDINIVNKNGENALMVAARVGNDQMFESLLDAGANLYIKNNSEQTVMEVAKSNGFTTIVETIERYESFINQGADAFTKDEEKQTEPTATSDVDVKVRDKAGQTPLMQFAALGNEEMVKKLLQLKSEIDAKDFNGATPLMLAARKGTGKVIKLILDAKPNVQLKDGQGRNALMHAIEAGSADAIKPLVDAGIKIDSRYLGATPLMIAAYTGNLEMIKALISCGADVSDKDTKGKNAVDYAKSKGHGKVAEFLENLLKNKKVA